jgi:polar amino acid transport system substrate-binding protein
MNELDWGRNGRIRAAINLGNPVLARRREDGLLAGLTVDLARELAGRLGSDLELIPYEGAGRVVEASRSDAWDVAFLATDPLRALDVAFTAPYLTIEGVLVVRGDALWRNLGEIDRPDIRIAVGRGAAYDLYLSRVLKQAQLVRVATSAEALPHFYECGLEAGAGIRQPAEAFVASRPGLQLIEEPFMQIRQAMAVPIDRADALPRLQAFLDEERVRDMVRRINAAILG